MGSSSISESSSYSQYTNSPITQEDVTNPLNLGTNARLTTGNVTVGGNLVMNNDAKTVGQAFDFGSKLVQVVADITRTNNAAKEQAAQDSTKEAAKGEEKASAFDWTKYKTELMLGAGIVALWWWGRK